MITVPPEYEQFREQLKSSIAFKKFRKSSHLSTPQIFHGCWVIYRLFSATFYCFSRQLSVSFMNLDRLIYFAYVNEHVIFILCNVSFANMNHFAGVIVCGIECTALSDLEKWEVDNNKIKIRF